MPVKQPAVYGVWAGLSFISKGRQGGVSACWFGHTPAGLHTARLRNHLIP